MKRSVAGIAVFLAMASSLWAHRLDQYLQATMLSIEKNRVQVFMRLIPGVAVSQAVIAGIDSNGDGVISESEQRAYAERVAGDVSLSVDGTSPTPRLMSVVFPKIEEMREGVGEIQITFSADLPGGGRNRRIVFENHHQSKISAYLVNCLVPSDPSVRIVSQNRDKLQSFYQVDVSSLAFWFRGFGSMFRLGVQHIAEGTDHLLFLLTLLLPAPLIAVGSRWGGFAGARRCLVQSLKVVTAFTLGHSLTLALAALGVVHVPNRPIEVLVALSILISAVHALRPLLPGREAGIAAFFGLIHGLAFASTLGSLGLGWQERVVSLLGFNMGIEAMQLMVVAATLPSLVLLGVTRAYSVFRVGGGLFAVFASSCWIAERMLPVHTPVDAVLNDVAGHAVWIAVVLFVISLSCWMVENKGERVILGDQCEPI
jgi:hypothetical protein